MRLADYEQAVEAGRRWIAQHGRYPQQQEWEHRAPGRPTTRTIKRRWGWEELMRAAAGAGARSPKLVLGKSYTGRRTLKRPSDGPWRTGGIGGHTGQYIDLATGLVEFNSPRLRDELVRWPTAGTQEEAERLRDLVFRQTGRGRR
jgi:hypothetical protein